MRINHMIIVSMVVLSFLGPLNLLFRYVHSTPPLGSIAFKKVENENGTKWIGTYNGNTEVKTNKIRLALFDEHKNLKETGLISDYFQNDSYGYFLVIKNSNNNSRLDPGDIFFLYENGEVGSDWGIVLTHEPLGKLIASNKIDGHSFFPMEDRDKKDDFGEALFIVIMISIGIPLIILAYKLPKKD